MSQEKVASPADVTVTEPEFIVKETKDLQDLSTPFDFQWEITLKDGTVESQFDDNGIKQKFNSDWFQPGVCKTISWVPYDPTRKQFDYDLEDYQKPIIVRRNYISIGTPSSEMTVGRATRVVYLLGCEWNEDGKVKKDLYYISPSFTVLVRRYDEKRKSFIYHRVTYPGAVERSSDPRFSHKLQDFVNRVSNLF